MRFDFDEEIDRREVPALKPHRIVLGADGVDLFPAGVADMDFRVAPPILEAMQKRLQHGVFGYETMPAGVNAGLNPHQTPEQKCTTWPVLAEVIMHHFG